MWQFFRENSIIFKTRILRQISDQKLWREFQRTLACLVAWLETTDNTDHLSDWWSQSLSSCLQINHKDNVWSANLWNVRLPWALPFDTRKPSWITGQLKQCYLKIKPFPLMSLKWNKLKSWPALPSFAACTFWGPEEEFSFRLNCS